MVRAGNRECPRGDQEPTALTDRSRDAPNRVAVGPVSVALRAPPTTPASLGKMDMSHWQTISLTLVSAFLVGCDIKVNAAYFDKDKVNALSGTSNSLLPHWLLQSNQGNLNRLRLWLLLASRMKCTWCIPQSIRWEK